MIRIDALWLCAQPLDMRAGAERLMAHVVHALGSCRAHHGYLFANARASRIKLSLALLAKLLRDPRPTIATSAVTVCGPYFGISSLFACSRALGARTRHWQNPVRDTDNTQHSRLTVYSSR